MMNAIHNDVSFRGTLKNYWLDQETNFFNNWIDAVFGVFVLFVLPLISLILTIGIDVASWENYGFPMFSICTAGAYDCYGRFDKEHKRNVKLVVRLALQLISFTIACFMIGQKFWLLLILPHILLLFSGIVIVFEAGVRIYMAISLSEWASIKGGM